MKGDFPRNTSNRTANSEANPTSKSKVKSKYIGETEKNLRSMPKPNAASKRTEVKDSHDRYAASPTPQPKTKRNRNHAKSKAQSES